MYRLIENQIVKTSREVSTNVCDFKCHDPVLYVLFCMTN